MSSAAKVVLVVVIGLIAISILFSLLGAIFSIALGILGFVWRFVVPIGVVVIIVLLIGAKMSPRK
ncbi:MAG: hypothetical protein FWB97_09965 [Oscillospiraceae bacterium]|nr:hypothetical protein [Oscillospiraceae bacterium]